MISDDLWQKYLLYLYKNCELTLNYEQLSHIVNEWMIPTSMYSICLSKHLPLYTRCRDLWQSHVFVVFLQTNEEQYSVALLQTVEWL